MQYATIVADPPWPIQTVGKYGRRQNQRPDSLPYLTMTLPEICALQVAPLAAEGCHLWLWTTNGFLRPAFDVMEAWGFTYLNTVTWVKPSGFGAWFANTTQHCLFGYKERCVFPNRRYAPTHFRASPKRHSAKPEQFYGLVEEVSVGPRLEMFARRHRLGYDVWGNEVESSIELGA